MEQNGWAKEQSLKYWSLLSIPCLWNSARNLQRVLEQLTWGRNGSCPHLRRECVKAHGLEIRLVCFALMAGCHSFLLAALLDHCSQAAVFLFPPSSWSRHMCWSTGTGPDCALSGLSQPEVLALTAQVFTFP